MKPSEIPITQIGTVGDTLGAFEREAGAAILVRYYRAHGDVWGRAFSWEDG